MARLKNVAICPDLVTNLVSCRLLKRQVIYWDMENNVLYRNTRNSPICAIREVDGQSVPQKTRPETAFAASQPQKRHHNSRRPWKPSRGETDRPLVLRDGEYWTHQSSPIGMCLVARLRKVFEYQACPQPRFMAKFRGDPQTRRRNRPDQANIFISTGQGWRTRYRDFVR